MSVVIVAAVAAAVHHVGKDADMDACRFYAYAARGVGVVAAVEGINVVDWTDKGAIDCVDEDVEGGADACIVVCVCAVVWVVVCVEGWCEVAAVEEAAALSSCCFRMSRNNSWSIRWFSDFCVEIA